MVAGATISLGIVVGGGSTLAANYSLPVADERGPAGDPNNAPLEAELLWQRLESDAFSKGALGLYGAENGDIVVVVPVSGSSSFSTKDDAASAFSALGVTVVVKTAALEPADLTKIKELTKEVAWTPDDRNTAFPAAIFNPRSGRVRIYTDAPRSMFEDVLEAYPDQVDFMGYALGLLSRDADYNPHYGGAQLAQLGNEWECSSGFSVTLNTTGGPRMVTAGHCPFDIGSTIVSTFGGTFGTFRLNEDTFPNTDAALVGGGGHTQAPYLYRTQNDGSDTPIIGVSSASDSYGGPPVTYCYSGASEYEHCGITLEQDGVELTFDWGLVKHMAQFLTAPGAGACGGDSGAPVYYKYSSSYVGIRGIVVGGNDRREPPPHSLCDTQQQTEVLMMPWYYIRTAYDVSIKVAP